GGQRMGAGDGRARWRLLRRNARLGTGRRGCSGPGRRAQSGAGGQPRQQDGKEKGSGKWTHGLAPVSARATQGYELGQQLLVGFRVGRVGIDALDGAHLDALRFVEMADAPGATRGVDDVDRLTLRDGLVGTCRLAYVAVDAELVDLQ